MPVNFDWKGDGGRHASPSPALPKEVTMKVTMKQTMTVYPDGIHELECLKGETYDLPEVAAKSWVKQGFAVVATKAAAKKATKQDK